MKEAQWRCRSQLSPVRDVTRANKPPSHPNGSHTRFALITFLITHEGHHEHLIFQRIWAIENTWKKKKKTRKKRKKKHKQNTTHEPKEHSPWTDHKDRVRPSKKRGCDEAKFWLPGENIALTLCLRQRKVIIAKKWVFDFKSLNHKPLRWCHPSTRKGYFKKLGFHHTTPRIT